MIAIINIPNQEFDNDVKDKFQDYFSRVRADLRDYPSHGKLCGNYEMETTDMFLASFKRLQVLPDNVTNGDIIKAMFPNAEYLTDNCNSYYMRPLNEQGEWGARFGWEFDLDWWNAPYKRGNENG